MFSHVMVGAHDIEASRKFYDAAPGAFAISLPIDGEPACHANGGVPSRVPPAPRESPFGTLRLAFLRDPAGSKICAMHRLG